MITHSAIWAAIDGLAERYALSVSGLARAAGLDPTTFNKSKRFTANGRERWPSTESLAKVLEATGANFDEFVNLLIAANPDQQLFGQVVPLIDMDEARLEGVFDGQGLPSGGDWDEIQFPGLNDPELFALEVVEDLYEPVYWAGDILIVSPKAELRRGDRVVVRFTDERVEARVFLRRSMKKIEVGALTDHERVEEIDPAEVSWVSRIVWARQ